MITCKKEDDKIKPVEVPPNSRVEIDYSGAIVNDDDWIEIDGVRYTHKLDSFNITSVLDSGYLLTTIKADSAIVIDTISIDTTGFTVDSSITQIIELQPPQIDTTATIIDTTQIIIIITPPDTTYFIDTTYVIQITYFNDTIYGYDTIYNINYPTVTSDTVIITTNNYHNPGGSLLLMLLKSDAFIQSIDTSNMPTISIVQSVTADSTKAQISQIYPGNVTLWDTFDLKIGATTVFYVATEPKISNVTFGLTQAIKDEMTANPTGDWSTELDSLLPALDKATYIELKGKNINTPFTVTSVTLNGAANYSADKYILKVKGGEVLNSDNMFDIRNALDWRAKTIQIESKIGTAINIKTITGYKAKITYY